MTCRAICRTLLMGTVLLAAIGATIADAAEAQTVQFGTDWKAEAEHGGYYQAIATGIYKRYGLDVSCGRAVRRSITPSCSRPACSTSISRRTPSCR